MRKSLTHDLRRSVIPVVAPARVSARLIYDCGRDPRIRATDWRLSSLAFQATALSERPSAETSSSTKALTPKVTTSAPSTEGQARRGPNAWAHIQVPGSEQLSRTVDG
jgi:hypothetical protein